MGFDYFFGYNCQRQAHEYYPEYLWRNAEKVMLDGKTVLARPHGRGGARRSCGGTRTGRSSSYLAFTIPHAKLQVPDLGPYADEPWPDNLKKLAAMITRHGPATSAG